MKKIGEIAKEFRISRGWNTSEMARAVGTSRQNIESLEEKGDRIPRYLANLAKTMGVTSDDLLKGRPVPADASNVSPGPRIRGIVPLLSSVQAGAFKEVLDSNNYPGDESMETVSTTVPVNKYTFALRVQGDSMEPKFTEGMLLIVEPELDAQHGDYVIVKNGSEETTFKQLIKDGSDWLLKPLNDRYPIKPFGSNTIVGVVRGVTEQFR